MPFLTHPRLFTCASCRIYGFWDHEKLVTKLEDILVPNKRPLQPAELTVRDKELCCSRTGVIKRE